MKRNIESALAKDGRDMDKYLSLRIHKGDLPNGGEIVITVRDDKGNLHPIEIQKPQNARAFARNSRFREKVMADGYVFNPYIHRRFISAQFRRLINTYGYRGVKEGVAETYNWDYAVDILRKEAHRLANLQKHDHSGYVERSRFFTLECCTQIVAAYAETVGSYLEKLIVQSTKDPVFVPQYGMLSRQNVRPMKHRFTQLSEQAKACRSYKQLDALLSDFNWLKLPNDLTLPMCFTEPFVEAGAFYTLKYHMMFAGLRMRELDQQASLAGLRNHTGSYLDLYPTLMI